MAHQSRRLDRGASRDRHYSLILSGGARLRPPVLRWKRERSIEFGAIPNSTASCYQPSSAPVIFTDA
jgi:hypothetical protein